MSGRSLDEASLERHTRGPYVPWLGSGDGGGEMKTYPEAGSCRSKVRPMRFG